MYCYWKKEVSRKSDPTESHRAIELMTEIIKFTDLVNLQGTIYSATSFLEKCRKVVREIWFEKSGSRNLVREKWLTRKKGDFIP